MTASLPPEFLSAISQEDIEFGVQATRRFPKSYRAVEILFFVIVVIYFSLSIIDSDLEFSNLDFESVITPLFLLFFAVNFFRTSTLIKLKDFYFAGTKTGIFSWHKGKLQKKEWKYFTDDIQVIEKDGMGDIVLKLKKLPFQSLSKEMFNPANMSVQSYEMIKSGKYYICGISNPRQVADICLRKIAENKIEV